MKCLRCGQHITESYSHNRAEHPLCIRCQIHEGKALIKENEEEFGSLSNLPKLDGELTFDRETLYNILINFIAMKGSKANLLFSPLSIQRTVEFNERTDLANTRFETYIDLLNVPASIEETQDGYTIVADVSELEFTEDDIDAFVNDLVQPDVEVVEESASTIDELNDELNKVMREFVAEVNDDEQEYDWQDLEGIQNAYFDKIEKVIFSTTAEVSLQSIEEVVNAVRDEMESIMKKYPEYSEYQNRNYFGTVTESMLEDAQYDMDIEDANARLNNLIRDMREYVKAERESGCPDKEIIRLIKSPKKGFNRQLTLILDRSHLNQEDESKARKAIENMMATLEFPQEDVLVYDSEAAEKFKDTFDVASPEETAKAFNKRVLHKKKADGLKEYYDDYYDDEYYDEEDEDIIDWYENWEGHPLSGAYDKACNELNVWAEGSTQGRSGVVIFFENKTDTPKYKVDFSDEIDFMDDLAYSFDDPHNLSDEDIKQAIASIKEFISSHKAEDYEDEEDIEESAEDKDQESLTEEVTDYKSLFATTTEFTDDFIDAIEKGGYDEDVFGNAATVWDMEEFGPVVLTKDNKIMYPFTYGGPDTRCLIHYSLNGILTEMGLLDEKETILADLEKHTGLSKETLLGDVAGDAFDDEEVKESAEGDQIAQDYVDSKNDNFEKDKETTREMRKELAKQGIATDEEGKPISEDYDFNDVEEAYTEEVSSAIKEAVQDDVVNQLRNPDPLTMNLAKAFAKGNSHILDKVSKGEKTLEQVVDEVSAQSNFLTKDMWNLVIRLAMFCDRSAIEESEEIKPKRVPSYAAAVTKAIKDATGCKPTYRYDNPNSVKLQYHLWSLGCHDKETDKMDFDKLRALKAKFEKVLKAYQKKGYVCEYDLPEGGSKVYACFEIICYKGKVEESRQPELSKPGVKVGRLSNRFNYTIRELKIDNDNKTYQVGDFIHGKPDKKFRSRKEMNRYIDDLKSKGYTEIKEAFQSMDISDIESFIENLKVKYNLKAEDLYDNGAIYYMNGNDGTDFDYQANGRTCEFYVFFKDEVGAIKCFVDKDNICAYVYDKEDPWNGSKSKYETTSSDFDLYMLCCYLQGSFDDKNRYDTEVTNWTLTELSYIRSDNDDDDDDWYDDSEEDDFDYYGDDTFGESCKTESIDNEPEDISHLIFDNHYGNKSVDELEVSALDEIDHYYKIVKSVHDAEVFNYHSDYWGHDEDYQEQNIELIDALSSYIGKMVEICYDDGAIRGKLVGIAIDKQYNSISHTKVVLESIEELNESKSVAKDLLSEKILDIKNSNLCEAFHKSIPDWLKKRLTSEHSDSLKKYFWRNNIALDKIKFVPDDIPSNARGVSELKRNNKLPIFKIDNHNSYVPMIDDEDTAPFGKREKYKYTSMKNIIDHATVFGYIDLSDASINTTSLQQSRADSKKGVITRGKGQWKDYGYELKGDYYDDNGKYHPGDLIYTFKGWVNDRELDKSGYLPDPDRYKRMLDNVGLNNYSDRLDKYYNRLVAIKGKLVKELQDYDIANHQERDSLDSVIGIYTSKFAEASDLYRRIVKDIDRVINDTERTEEQKDKSIRHIFIPENDFESAVGRLRKAIEKVERHFRDKSESLKVVKEGNDSIFDKVYNKLCKMQSKDIYNLMFNWFGNFEDQEDFREYAQNELDLRTNETAEDALLWKTGEGVANFFVNWFGRGEFNDEGFKNFMADEGFDPDFDL